MIHFIEGNLLESKAQALVNTVNTVGVMGKGIALQFKKMFPYNNREYVKVCKEDALNIGQLLVIADENLLIGKKIIINFPTKKDWKQSSQYSYIESGLTTLVSTINQYNISSIAIPPLGCGSGGLQWNIVKSMMEKHLSHLNCDIYIYQPNYEIKEIIKKERVKLSPARAMLLAVLYDMVRNGEFISEFASEKICYFLQRFGGEIQFNLQYEANFYGPYSGKVKHLLHHLNGSYIMGYVDKNKKPFEALELLMETEQDVIHYLYQPNNQAFLTIVKKTTAFFTGFYAAFGMELLSTVDYIAQVNQTSDAALIKEQIALWSNRKKTMFNNQRFIDIAITQLKDFRLMM